MRREERRARRRDLAQAGERIRSVRARLADAEREKAIFESVLRLATIAGKRPESEPLGEYLRDDPDALEAIEHLTEEGILEVKDGAMVPTEEGERYLARSRIHMDERGEDEETVAVPEASSELAEQSSEMVQVVEAAERLVASGTPRTWENLEAELPGWDRRRITDRMGEAEAMGLVKWTRSEGERIEAVEDLVGGRHNPAAGQGGIETRRVSVPNSVLDSRRRIRSADADVAKDEFREGGDNVFAAEVRANAERGLVVRLRRDQHPGLTELMDALREAGKLDGEVGFSLHTCPSLPDAEARLRVDVTWNVQGLRGRAGILIPLRNEPQRFGNAALLLTLEMRRSVRVLVQDEDMDEGGPPQGTPTIGHDDLDVGMIPLAAMSECADLLPEHPWRQQAEAKIGYGTREAPAAKRWIRTESMQAAEMESRRLARLPEGVALDEWHLEQSRFLTELPTLLAAKLSTDVLWAAAQPIVVPRRLLAELPEWGSRDELIDYATHARLPLPTIYLDFAHKGDPVLVEPENVRHAGDLVPLFGALVSRTAGGALTAIPFGAARLGHPAPEPMGEFRWGEPPPAAGVFNMGHGGAETLLAVEGREDQIASAALREVVNRATPALELVMSALYALEAANVTIEPAPLTRRQAKVARRRELHVAGVVRITHRVYREPDPDPEGSGREVHVRHWVRGHYKHFRQGTRVFKNNPDRHAYVPDLYGEGQGGWCVKVWCPPHQRGPEDAPLKRTTRVWAPHQGDLPSVGEAG